ncbi:TetR/AcrR family transcriptional regulator [Chondromyces crocatus]|uniref:TetR family transcriptional regulator n=1 Tax=Chondromyces crocatus TaxID=52 RepID=A0A0K1ENE9_CHOCO|nr:TetR/AcrR family transcriptional regulator [Chondromyces crocatus]AKT42113.1 TetR family transcriptional regulator [Chondromyces crocatus]
MARNEERRRKLLDASIHVLAQQGARGLTHRAVDAEAGVPTGTASNYFRSRDALVAQIFERISERLKPDPEVLAALARRRPSRALFADYMRDIVARLTRERMVTLALFELRLEATRNPEIAQRVGEWMRNGFVADVAFNERAGLPGGRHEIALFHYALDGLLLDRLTISLDPETPTDDVVDALVSGLLPSRLPGRAAPKKRSRS